MVEFLQFIVSNLPVFFNYFFPGYFFLVMYRYFTDARDTTFDHMLIASIAISYLISLVAPLLTPNTSFEALPYLIDVGIAALLAVVAILLRKLSGRKKLLIALGNITGNKQIWYDIFQSQNRNEGKILSCCTSENGKEYHIKGKIAYFDPYGESGCRIALTDYTIKQVNQGKDYGPGFQTGALLYLDASKLYLLETFPDPFEEKAKKPAKCILKCRRKHNDASADKSNSIQE